MPTSNIKIGKLTLTSKHYFYAGSIAFLLAVLLLAWTLAIQYSSNTNSVSAAKPLETNQMIRTGNVDLKIRNVRFIKGSGMFAAPAGKQYVVFDLWVQNISDKPIQVLPSTDTYMKTMTGDVSYLSPYKLSNPFKAGELPSGEAIHGELSYIIPQDTSVNLYLDANWSGSVIPIAIQQGVDQ
ncbi:DUF4352 domain-containing protein [Candidatus Saccharibacteria bacterium]|nr:DUF4352 domain-containing protein [Candidatus Saccharibacteria bacterium]